MLVENRPFVHLRVHTAYSLCEGAVKIDELVELCSRNKIPACSITDTNNMFGVLDFSIQCSSAGVQPIVGCQLDITFAEAKAPIIVISKNGAGYKNLLKLMTCFYTYFCVTIENLQQHKEGLVILSGGYKGPAGVLYLQNLKNDANQFLETLNTIFLDNFYIEISRTFSSEEIKTEDFFVQYAVEKSIPLIATNEVFFLEKDMHAAQDILMCITDGTYVSQTDRRRVSEHCYLKTSEEMYDLFRDIPEAVINTSLVAQRCGVMSDPHAPMLPCFSDGSDLSEADILWNLAQDGLSRRITNPPQEYIERLKYEYTVIKKMGFCGYFLIVSDFVMWAKKNGIPVGPGRGSGAGSIVAWSLRITDLDPIKYRLFFERFLNPDRVSMPDFDIDFCQERRDEVIDYIKTKYGSDKVAHIIAFGKLQARAVLKDVGRVIQMPYGKVDRIAKLVPHNPVHPVDLKQALEIEPEFSNMMKDDESVNFLVKTGLQLEGLYRHASVHAAGIVVGQTSIDRVVPIYMDGESDLLITQFNMKFVEKAGLVKFDLLGLKTLTMIKQACDLVDVNIETIPLDDQKTFELLQNANVLGIFQLESVGMREVIQKLKPDNLEDIIALISLYRPGPMDSISTYLARKHGEQIVTYPHPYIEDILSSTYGIMIYQEQVMKIAQAMGGYSLAQADLLRRAMGKKIPEEMAKHKQIFIDGAKKQNISTDVAASIFAQMEKFAGYGFNRSHAAAYALISYQTAYLKANYMHAFYVALMNIEIANTDKIATYVQDAKMNDIGVLPPDINKSSPIFKKEDGCIRYALGAIKGSSVSSSQEIVETRNMYGKFDSLQHFFEQIDRKSINKRQMDSLIMAGTFDCLHQNRNQVLDRFSKLSTTNTQTASQNQQRSLFNNVSKQGALCDCPEWDYMEKLEKERVAIGFYLTSHPIDMYLEVLRDVGIQKSGQFLYERQQQRQLTVAGVLLSKQEKLSKGSQKYAFITVSDQDNSYEITVLPNLYPSVSHLLISGKVLLMEINIKNMDGASRISAQLIKDVDSIISTQKIYLELDDTADIAELQKFLASLEDGSNQISFVVRNSSARYTEIETSYKKNMTIKNRDKIKQLRGIKIFKKASGLLKNFPRSTNL